jgi:hypothetical protein
MWQGCLEVSSEVEGDDQADPGVDGVGVLSQPLLEQVDGRLEPAVASQGLAGRVGELTVARAPAGGLDGLGLFVGEASSSNRVQTRTAAPISALAAAKSGPLRAESAAMAAAGIASKRPSPPEASGREAGLAAAPVVNGRDRRCGCAAIRRPTPPYRAPPRA